MFAGGPFVLIRDGVEIARHPHRITCVMEAIDRKLAVRNPNGTALVEGVEIRPVQSTPQQH
ncbi:hypothetical protein DYI37_03975 [Fulvimarina endophytica]|uniref:Uncharacterized protein n=1 Tax=Fulvimarina endophytica TaxID=2293836 RepID=A0A371X718_9HYPH|nr:hypothetical protein [Fulvimarina endophytica]RFC65032.1 hypothetical protein DYI37_03975 [Fulvimarina endophytica]